MSDPPLQLWFTDATEAGCRVFAQWTAAAASEPEVWLHGPESAYASTLRARYPLRRRPGVNRGPLEAWIEEPCFWTPTGPYLYRCEARVSPPSVETVGLLGIRRLATRRDFLELDQKRWVLRGAVAAEPVDFPGWHEAPLAAVVDDPSDELCDQASRVGVLLVARVKRIADVAAELRRLARWPAVGGAILDHFDDRVDLRREAPNLIPAQWFSAGAALEPAPWARLLFCEVDDPVDFARRVAGVPQPIVAARKGPGGSTPTEARAACDQLQRKLAAAGIQMAGYVV